MALTIITDRVQEDKDVGSYTAYFYVVDDADPTKRLAETTVQGNTAAEVKTKLAAKYARFKKEYDRQQQLKTIGDNIAQQVVNEA